MFAVSLSHLSFALSCGENEVCYEVTASRQCRLLQPGLHLCLVYTIQTVNLEIRLMIPSAGHFDIEITRKQKKDKSHPTSPLISLPVFALSKHDPEERVSRSAQMTLAGVQCKQIKKFADSRERLLPLLSIITIGCNEQGCSLRWETSYFTEHSNNISIHTMLLMYLHSNQGKRGRKGDRDIKWMHVSGATALPKLMFHFRHLSSRATVDGLFCSRIPYFTPRVSSTPAAPLTRVIVFPLHGRLSLH